MAILRGLSSLVKGEVIEMTEDETTIGRHDMNVLPVDDMSVSSFHCAITKDDEKYTLRDLDSTNGVRVDGEKVTMRVLQPGTIVQVGSVEFMFEDEDVAEQSVQAVGPRVNLVDAVEDELPATGEAGVVPEGGASVGGTFELSARYKGKGIWITVGVAGIVALIGVIVFSFMLFRLG